VALLAWSDEYSVGLEHVDAQHRRWFEFLNVLHDAMLAGEADDVVGAVLLDMWEYTRSHFADEEALMEKYAFPGFQGHKRVHAAFVAQLQDKMADHEAGSTRITLDTMRMLKEWLVRHITQMDQHYAVFIQEKLAAEPEILDEAAPLAAPPAERVGRCPPTSLHHRGAGKRFYPQ
jgi:hemerythrin-like metal-binding protein